MLMNVTLKIFHGADLRFQENEIELDESANDQEYNNGHHIRFPHFLHSCVCIGKS